MSKKLTARDPLRPLDGIVSVLVGIVLFIVVFGGAWAVFDDSVTVFDMDRDSVCVDGAFGAGNETTMSSADRESNGVRAGMTTQSTGTTVCDPDPGGIEIALIGLTTIPSFLIFCVLIFGTQRVIRYAQHHGLFSARLAARIERLGWVLLLGLVGAAVIEWLAGGLLLTRLLTDQSWTRGSFDLSITGIIGAYGLVSIGRVIRRAAILQDQVHDLTT